MLTTREQEDIEILERRADHLAKRIVQAKAEGKDLSWDRRELGCLGRVIAKLQIGGHP